MLDLYQTYSFCWKRRFAENPSQAPHMILCVTTPGKIRLILQIPGLVTERKFGQCVLSQHVMLYSQALQLHSTEVKTPLTRSSILSFDSDKQQVKAW